MARLAGLDSFSSTINTNHNNDPVSPNTPGPSKTFTEQIISPLKQQQFQNPEVPMEIEESNNKQCSSSESRVDIDSGFENMEVEECDRKELKPRSRVSVCMYIHIRTCTRVYPRERRRTVKYIICSRFTDNQLQHGDNHRADTRGDIARAVHIVERARGRLYILAADGSVYVIDEADRRHRDNQPSVDGGSVHVHEGRGPVEGDQRGQLLGQGRQSKQSDEPVTESCHDVLSLRHLL